MGRPITPNSVVGASWRVPRPLKCEGVPQIASLVVAEIVSDFGWRSGGHSAPGPAATDRHVACLSLCKHHSKQLVLAPQRRERRCKRRFH